MTGAVRQARGARYGEVGGGGAVPAGAVDQITDLTADDHACLTFGEPADMLGLTSAFVLPGAGDMAGVALVSGHGG